jgi:hypothetical protein
VVCWLTLPTIALGLGAIVLSVARAIELGVFAPVATTAFASALGERLACDAIADARRLCACLEPAWAAHLAGEVMDAKMRGDDAHFALECSLVEWRARSLRHLQVICTLGRIARARLRDRRVEPRLRAGCRAGDRASPYRERSRLRVRAFVTGFATSLFCQLSVTNLLRQARTRNDELRIVAEVLTGQMLRTTR